MRRRGGEFPCAPAEARPVNSFFFFSQGNLGSLVEFWREFCGIFSDPQNKVGDAREQFKSRYV